MNIVSGSYTVQTLNYSNRTVLITDSSLTNNQGCFGDISDRSFVISSGKPLHLHDTVFIFTGCDRSKGPLLEGSKYRCNFSNDICSAYQRCGSNPARNFPGCCSHRADAVDYINLETLNCSSNGLNMGFTSVVNLNPLDDSADWVHGFQMQWNGILTTSKQCDACSSSKGVCGYDQSDKSFLCYCSGGVNRTTTCSTGSSRSPPSPDDNLDAPSPQPPSPSDTGKSKKSVVVPVALSLGVGLGMLVGLLCLHQRCRRHRRSKSTSGGKFEGFTLDDVVMEATLRFTYKELVAATNNFREELGRGGFGVVHKGVLSSGETVAVKQLQGSKQGEKEFRTEMATLGNIQHPNLVRLFGYCFEGSQRLLVYEYMENASLDRYIFRSSNGNMQLPILQWGQRFRIAVNTTRALHHLHEGCKKPIVHYNMKPSNILLDRNFTPKVTDFGLAKLMDKDHSQALSCMRGTYGYLAPEWMMGDKSITEKSDVYSWGMVLLEIVGGRRNMDPDILDDRKIYFPEWVHREIESGDIAELLDKDLLIERVVARTIDAEQVKVLCRVALWCIQEEVSKRPTMKLVLDMLEGMVPVERPPYPFKSRSGISALSEDLWGERSNATSLSSSFDSRTLVR